MITDSFIDTFWDRHSRYMEVIQSDQREDMSVMTKKDFHRSMRELLDPIEQRICFHRSLQLDGSLNGKLICIDCGAEVVSISYVSLNAISLNSEETK